jgi:hypothetical protein
MKLANRQVLKRSFVLGLSNMVVCQLISTNHQVAVVVARRSRLRRRVDLPTIIECLRLDGAVPRGASWY